MQPSLSAHLFVFTNDRWLSLGFDGTDTFQLDITTPHPSKSFSSAFPYTCDFSGTA